MMDYRKLADALFDIVEKGENLYAILDGARSIEIASALQNVEVEKESLYRGRSEEPLWDVAPYLIRCERGALFFQWVLERGWGNSWGIYLTSKASLQELLKHFQQFLLVKLAEEKDFYFRFYDPRVLRAFLPTCTVEESRDFFGPVRCYLVEEKERETLLKFAVGQNGTLREAIAFF
jgi:hypothetical protein